MTTHVYEFDNEDGMRRFAECILTVRINVRGSIIAGDIKNIVKVEYEYDALLNKKRFLDAAACICGGHER